MSFKKRKPPVVSGKDAERFLKRVKENEEKHKLWADKMKEEYRKKMEEADEK